MFEFAGPCTVASDLNLLTHSLPVTLHSNQHLMVKQLQPPATFFLLLRWCT